MISAPANPTKAETVQLLSDRLCKHDHATLFPFVIPDFKVGTLDSLIVLSDELQKTDGVIEGMVVKISDSLKGLLGGDMAAWKQALVVGDSTYYFAKNLETVGAYLEAFAWNTMKYRSDKTLKELVDNIVQVSILVRTIRKFHRSML